MSTWFRRPGLSSSSETSEVTSFVKQANNFIIDLKSFFEDQREKYIQDDIVNGKKNKQTL